MSDITPAPGAQAPDSPQGEGSEITVCITMNAATGEFSVGIEPPEAEAAAAAPAIPGGEPAPGAEEEAEKAYMKPARDIDDALRQAKQLLEQPQSADGGANPFEQGFAQARGTPLDTTGAQGA